MAWSLYPWPATYGLRAFRSQRCCANTCFLCSYRTVGKTDVYIHTCMWQPQCMHMGVYRQASAGELLLHCHIFGMAVLCPRLLHSWRISMRCGVVTGTGADMLSHCDEKHSEMMWRECSSCPQRDGKPAVAFVYSRLCLHAYVKVCVHTCIFSGCILISYTYCLPFKPISLYAQSGWLCFCSWYHWQSCSCF